MKNKRLPKTSLDYYDIISLLGEGTFGKVWLAKEILTGQKVAIKYIPKIRMRNEYVKQKILGEVNLQKKLFNINIIRLLEVFENE